jgi:hypothetical protein
MKRENIAKFSLILSSAAFIVSVFSLVMIYGLFIELKNLEPYITKPQAALSPSTAIFPTTFIGRFLLVAFPSLLTIILFAVVLFLILIYKKD